MPKSLNANRLFFNAMYIIEDKVGKDVLDFSQKRKKKPKVIKAGPKKKRRR